MLNQICENMFYVLILLATMLTYISDGFASCRSSRLLVLDSGMLSVTYSFHIILIKSILTLQTQLLVQYLISNKQPQYLSFQAMNKEQLNHLLAQSEIMTQQLMAMRNSVLNGTCSSDYHLSSDTLSKACQHRQLLRRLAETLQANRGLAQLNKQRIQKSRVMLEGLDYFKKTLKDKIQSYHTDVDPIDQYFDEPIGHIDWQKDYESGQRRLKQSLQRLKMKDQMYRNTINNKLKIEKQIEQKSKLFNVVMPKQIKKLNDQVVQMTKIFGIEANEGLERIENAQLAYLYDTIKTLKRVDKIDMKLSKQDHQYIDLIIKPNGFDLYERALQYGIKLQEKQLKIRVSSMKPDFNKLVIGVDRRSDFSNRDIFHRLINREDIKPVFRNPLNQSQRNVNNRFVYMEWLEANLCIEAIKCSTFFQLVRTRVFTTALINYIFDSLKNPIWLSTVTPPIFSQITSRRITFDNVQRINFAEYKSSISISPILKKSLNEYEEKQIKKDKTEEEQIQFEKVRTTLIQYLQRMGMEQLIVPEIYNYFKIIVSYKALKATCVVLMPSQYPDIAPKIKVVGLERPLEHENQEIVSGVECKASIQSKQLLSRQLDIIERESNSPFSMLNEGINDPFRIIYYLSKLFNSVYAVQNSYVERSKTIK